MLYKSILFYLMFGALWPTYAGVKVGAMPIINLHRIASLLFLTFLTANMIYSRGWLDSSIRKLKRIKTPLFLVSLFFSLRLISSFVSKDVSYSLFVASLEVLLQFILMLAVVLSFKNLDDVKIGIKVLLIGALLVVLLGLIESVTEYNIFANLYPSGSEGTEYIASAVEKKYREGYRSQGAFMHPLVLAEYLIFVIPISIYLLTSNNIFTKVCAIVVFMGGLYVLYSTGSRSGMVVLVVQALFYVYIYMTRKIKSAHGLHALFNILLLFLTVGIVAILSLLYGIDLIKGRETSETTSSIARLIQLEHGLEAVRAKPIFGYGPGFGADYASVIHTSRASVDNYYLTIVVESGIPALIALAIVLIMFYRYARKIKTISNDSSEHLSDALSCSIVGFIVFNTILSTYEIFGIVYVVFGFILVLKVDDIDCMSEISA